VAITSAQSPRNPRITVYQEKKASLLPDDLAEVRVAELLDAHGNDIHFTDGIGKADLEINGTRCDVKHPRTAAIKSAITSGKQQGNWVLLDGTTARLTLAAVDAGIKEFERVAQQHPGPVAGIRRVIVVLASGKEIAIHDRAVAVPEKLLWRGHLHRI